MPPLTWKDTTLLQDGNRDFLAAANMVENSGLGGLNKALTGYQKQQGDIFAADQARNLQALQESLRSQFKTPEELQAAINSGAVNQLMNPMGDRIDRSKALSFADAQVKDLRNNFTAEETFKNLKAKAAAAPIMDSITAAQNRGDFGLAKKLMDDNASVLKGFEGSLEKSANDARLNKIRLDSAIQQDAVDKATGATNLQTSVVGATNALTTAQNTAKINAQTQEADAMVKDITNSFRTEEAAKLGKIKELTKAFGLAVNPKTGLADYEKSDPEAVVAYAKELKNQKLDGSVASTYYNNARAKLGNLDPSIQEKALGTLGKFLDPDPVLTPKDQLRMDNQLANLVSKVDTAKKNNAFYQDPATVTDELTSLLVQAEKDMKGEPLNTLDIRAKLGEMVNKGIDIKLKGVTTIVPITVKLLKQAYAAGMDPDTLLTPNRTLARLKEHLETTLSNQSNIDLFYEAEGLRNEKYKGDARVIKDSFYGLSGTVSPATEASRASDYATQFEDKLQKEKKAAFEKKQQDEETKRNSKLRESIKPSSKKERELLDAIKQEDLYSRGLF